MKHVLASGPDQVSGEVTTRCGLKGLTLGGLRYSCTGGHFDVTALHVTDCPKCAVRLKPIEKKILRLMLDYPKRDVMFVVGNSAFSWNVNDKLTFYGRRGFYHGLPLYGLIRTNTLYNWGLTETGRAWAKTLPQVKEEIPF